MSKLKSNHYEDEVEHYFYSLRKYKHLSREEECYLGLKIQNGDEQALNKLVEHNLRFVIKIAKGYRDRGVPFADIISEGNLGLMHAAKKFDPTKGIKFISYAVWWIRCYISDYINIYNGNNEISVEDYTSYQNKESLINYKFEENLNKLNDVNSTIADLLVCLKGRERDIIEMSFGLKGEKEMTLDEISKVTYLSKERVRQIKDTAMMKLKCEALSRPTNEFIEMKTLS